MRSRWHTVYLCVSVVQAINMEKLILRVTSMCGIKLSPVHFCITFEKYFDCLHLIEHKHTLFFFFSEDQYREASAR